MLVFTQVSSMKTSRRGSSPSISTRQTSRRATTSGRNCSAAYRTFFECEGQIAQRTP
jgi:hypothetical protein